MNLIVHSTPKDIAKSLGGALAIQLAGHLGGKTRTLRLYDSNQGYFNYQSNEEWVSAVISARHIILPVPVWNFSIPAALKDFFDYIIKEGKLWKMEKDGSSLGLLSDRPVYIIMTSGWNYPSGSAQDFIVPYLRCVFSFIGIKNVKDFRVSGVSNNEKLIADKAYFEDKARQMYDAFNV